MRHIINAAMAQSVERRLGKAEVGGSSPLGSFLKTLDFSRVLFFYTHFIFQKRKYKKPPLHDFLIREAAASLN